MRIGIDLGGTKTEGIVLSDEGAVVRRRVPSARSYGATLDTLAELVAGLERDVASTCSVGLGIPGSLSPRTGLVRNANSTWLQGHPLGLDLSQRLGRPVRVANDADCFALSEATDGSGEGASPVFGAILGTGVGGGLVVGGRLLQGFSGIAGEWGHIALPVSQPSEFPGPHCWCGRNGCVEAWLSGPGMSGDHARVTGEKKDAREIADAAARGDANSVDTLRRYAERLGRALSIVVNVFDPEVVVLGGGVSNIAGLPERTEASLHQHVFSDLPEVRVRRHRHGDSSGVRGAAWLWSPADLASGAAFARV